jgi:mono/diheme cytochrome c family protein
MRPVAFSIVFAGLAGCGDGHHEHPELTTGKQLFDHHCAQCHQESGEGAFLRGIPPLIYTTMTYRQLVDYVQGLSRSDHGGMPTFPTMPKAEAEKIAIYVRRKLKPR